MEMKAFSVYIETLGCAKNQVDSEVMLGLFQGNEYLLAQEPEEADIIVVNTCGFIESAKTESVETMLELLEYKKHGKCNVFIVAGCLVERYAEDLAKEMPEIDAFVGTTNFDGIVSVVNDVFEENKTVIRTGNIDKVFDEDLPRLLTTPNYYAYLKIAEGCDNFCTYCIIPQLRGKYRSRQMEDILKEAEYLVGQGVKELLIIAQDTTRYGMDLYGELKLADLLVELNKIEGLKWIRLHYCYPDMIDDKLVETMAKLEKVCHYIDIPIQHCNNAVLKRMNRTTSKEQIIEVVHKLRAAMPDITIRTTLIAGFPGETEAQFEELITFVEEMRFERLGAFAYSKEENTPAANFEDQIDEETRMERQGKVMAVQMGISESLLAAKTDAVMDVLIEEMIDENKVYVGRTAYDSPEVDGVVYVHTDKTLEMGAFVKVRITDAMEYDLIGEYNDEHR